MIRVLIIARIPLVRAGLRSLLSSEQNMSVSALDELDSSLVQRILARQPDVVLIDSDVLERDGWELLRELRSIEPDLKLIVVGDRPDDRRTGEMLALGAQGYLLRDASAEEMGAAIRAASLKLYVLHPGAAEILLQPFTDPRRVARETEVSDEEFAGELVEPLSPRELEVLRLIARGFSNKQIAAQLNITEHTAKFHLRSILGKLGVSNRTEAVTAALQRGLVSL